MKLHPKYEFEIDKHNHLTIDFNEGRIHLWTDEKELHELFCKLGDFLGYEYK